MLRKLNKTQLSVLSFPVLFTLFFGVASYWYHQKWCTTQHYDATKVEVILYTILNLVILLIWPLFNFLVLVPRLFESRYVWLTLILQIPLLYFNLYLHALLDYVFLNRFHINWLLSYEHVVSRFFINIAFALLFSIARLVLVLIEKQEQKNQLQLAQNESQLRFLRAQINPHFLFNALNNIYSYAIQKKDETPELILKLSGILRFLSSSNTRHQAGNLRQEVEVIEQLTELYRVNKRWQSKIKCNIDTQLLENNYTIEPHSLLTLVENAFKHCNLDAANGFIDISIQLNEQLVLQVKNTIRTDEAPEKLGIGLDNLKQRLTLAYPHTHTYSVTKESGIYQVMLILPLVNKMD